MTFPPCFSSFPARPSIDSASRSLLLRHHQQQSRLFSTLAVPHSQPTFEPRSATVDIMQEDYTDSSQDSPNEEQGQESMEGNAARMLLGLSKIVSKEISADSSCITIGGEKNKNDDFHQDALHQKIIRHSPERNVTCIEHEAVSPPSVTIPKSIEIHNPDCGSLVSTNSRESIPHEVLATRSFSYSSLTSPLTPNTLPTSISQNSFEGNLSTTNTSRRYRTVSLVGDELVPKDRELSPLLLPLNAPEFSFSMQNTTPRRLFRNHQLDLNVNLEHDALRRALGAKVSSSALASAAIITPIPKKPRPLVSFKSNILVDGKNHSTNTSLTNETTEDRKKRHFSMDLHPLVVESTKRDQESSSSKTPARAARSYTKRSSPGRKATAKKHHTKKKTPPKKQPRQRHAGKKFSWKAYPVLEEFLITNREEYLSFSAKNYTIEQRDYNNRLTSRLLEQAEANGYSNLFASCAFSAVRDRIRSYYKSYVQSFKRRMERQEHQNRLKELEMTSH